MTCRLSCLSQVMTMMMMMKNPFQRKSTIQMSISGMLAVQAGRIQQVQVGSSRQARIGRAQQAQAGKILNGLRGITGMAKTSSTKTQMVGGRTTQAEEKMIKMVNAKSFTGTM